ncbi:GNAT family N-acetyltransferase [Novosphingobium tardum]|uniref:GNAT family N-acetyltransferase n=1 Tax=Novosphingobium tardum TaxID=1538021 RepID=A0ABV8RTV6_9SPHN
MRGTIEIARASLDDAAAVAAIYAVHVREGTASFETEPPTAAEMAARMARVLDAGWPWLVARDGAGAVVGYAYAAQFRDRPAYRFACENSVYIEAWRRGQRIGGALLAALLDAATACGFRQMIAVIGGAEPASVALHARAGFAETGRMRSVGRKHGRWLDTLYMQRALGVGDTTPPEKEPA